jgi:hypothetical protein
MLGTLNGETERLLAQGQDAARKGDRPAARSLLTQVVERDPHNELAWMWLSGVVEEPEEQQICLENVLVINPHNAKARRGLEFISTKTGIPPHYPPVPSEHGNAAAEFTAPLTDSPIYGELASQFGQWPPTSEASSNGPSGDEGNEASAAILAWMQTTGADTPSSDVYGAPPAYQVGMDSANGAAPHADAWNMPAQDFGQAFQQEQLDWNQPGADFSALSLAAGVDDRFAQLEAAGGMGFDGSDMPFGVEPFAPAAGTALAGGAGAGFGTAGEGAAGMAAASGGAGAFEGMGPMGLHSDSNLPSPSDLPRFEERPEQPWYLQGDQQPTSNDELFASRNLSEPNDGTRQAAARKKEPGSMVECPHCKALVADTSLSCPQCKFLRELPALPRAG